MDLRPGLRYELDIERLDDDGAGLASRDGAAFVVPGAFPGERVRVQVQARSRHHPRAFSLLLDLLRPHPQRREPPCRNHRQAGGRCDGCALMALQPEGQRALHLARLRGLGIAVDRFEHAAEGEAPDGGALGYRCAAKRLAFADSEGRLRLGARQRGGAAMALMAGCRVDHPAIERALSQVEAAARALGVAAACDAKGAALAGGELQAVWAMTDGTAVLVTLVAARPDAESLRALPELCDTVAGWALATGGGGNDLRGSALRPLAGRQALVLDVEDADAGQRPGATAGEPRLRIEAPVGGFLQPNPALARRAWSDLCRLVDGAPIPNLSLAVDLFAGAGATTALLRRAAAAVSGAEVIAVEASPPLAAALGVAPARALDAVQALRAAGRRPDLVVANPPRAGLGAELCAALVALRPRRLHLMSCNPTTLRQDLDRLAPLRLLGARGYETLPQTPHLEVVAWLADLEALE